MTTEEQCPHKDKDHIAKCGCLCQGTRKLDRLEAEKAELQKQLDELRQQKGKCGEYEYVR